MWILGNAKLCFSVYKISSVRWTEFPPQGQLRSYDVTTLELSKKIKITSIINLNVSSRTQQLTRSVELNMGLSLYNLRRSIAGRSSQNT